MNSAFDLLMTEHAAWHRTRHGYHRVFASPSGARYSLKVHKLSSPPDQLVGDGGILKPDLFRLTTGAVARAPELATALEQLGTVARIRNSDLWDAIGTAIIRQVIRAAHAKRMYRSFCDAYGELVQLPTGKPYPLFPSATAVLDLSDRQFADLGMAFKCRALRAAARAYSLHGDEWQQLSPTALVEALRSVPHIGPWTARAAVADWSNEWALYPYADLAVRTWAKRAAPAYPWPSDERTFAEHWRALAGDHLSTMTLLTLAWGSHNGECT